ncbi:glycosyltransferase family 1 protein [bacterium]|nr:MAG: glycosyltransferase family 1 protein [bacterium]
MKIFIDIRSLDARYTSGVPGYIKLLIENMLTEAPGEDYIFFANSFRRNLEKTDLPQKYKGTWLNLGLPNRLLDLTNHFLNFPKIDRIIPADVFFSPHFNILSFKNPEKHVLTIHDISFYHYPDFFSHRKQFWHWQQDWRKQIENAGRIIANSDYTGNDIIETLRTKPEKVKRIYPGVDPFYRKMNKNDVDLIRFRNEKGLNKPFLLSVGTLEPRKNIIATIRAFNFLKQSAAFRDLELIIVGPRGWLYDKILKEAKSSPWQNKIRIWGKATREEILFLYNLASVFVYPSFFEGFGFPPLEAQACGLPVVASNRSSLPEVLGKSALLTDPWRVGELALAIESVLTDNKTSEMLKIRGFENIKRFNWPNAAREVVALLKTQAY